MADRFDLEQQLMNLSTTLDDLDLIAENVIEGGVDGEGYCADSLSNALIGLRELFELRFQKAWNTFEALVHEGQFKTPKSKHDKEYV